MSQIKFGQRYVMTPQDPRRNRRAGEAVAAVASQDDNGLRLGLMIAAGMLTGFVIAAIECL